MNKFYNGLLIISLLAIGGIKSGAQDDDRALLRQVAKQNQDAVDAIALYPTETRKIIFKATEYPEIIVKLNSMQKYSQDTFERVISFLSKDDQEKIWNMTRYDGLISDLTAKYPLSADDLNKIITDYPEEIQNTAKEEQKNNLSLLVNIDKINKNYNSNLELFLSEYPDDVRTVFRQIIKMPEVLSLLFDHMQYTVVVGEYYKKNPERVIHKTDSLNQVLTQKNTQEAQDWKQSLNNNPQAQDEYVQAAQDYAQYNGYQPDDYYAPLTQDALNYDSSPFDWWFGYPSWYPYNYWNPYPYWYDCGFYYGPGRSVVYFGMPSSNFMNWYFYYPEHFSKYPELSNHYYNYYNSHTDSRNYNSISRSVNNWRNRNSDIITDDWEKDNAGRVQRFKEYGQMETDRKNYNLNNPKQPVNQSEYLQNVKDKYPLLSADVSKKQSTVADNKSNSAKENIPEPVKVPVVKVPNVNTNQNNIKQNANINQNNIKENANINQIRTAQEYHKNTWNQMQSQNTAPAPRQEENRQPEQPARQNYSSPAPSSSGGGRRR